ncbi:MULTISPECIES: xanthine dehydrogenase family protein molybdopterin-binding subunit [Leeuwenhoekiella]|uniref:xanthine dehydrogenase family protein molybdopterin-binding subunit n=1 Tax=Leeuwenhoekiella TaxID=283735 RepID=UPI000C63EA60|nr:MULTISPECIES: molybdopterin cofactor-binding domain-containing protein [Leeuwenhoekiella]MAO42256.1 isoquinoline 1-oxidoreductase [Leeuwenhoekiella sp.]|tara:strand:- start:1412 stop:3601 length:2190 start_codon:yes stop_codon:yes gene_type:complete
MAFIKTKHNRRSFLKVSAAGGAGLMLQFSWFSGLAQDTATPAEAAFDLNAYIKMNEDGTVTIFSPNPEIGQNVKTSMPLIVAEELDVAWDQVSVEQAPLDTKKFSRQIAGGSQSIRAGWNGLRMAGATARYLFVSAAANLWNIPAEDLVTEAGMVKHLPTNKSIAYKELIGDAISIELPEEVKLKEPKDFKLIGTAVKNVDGVKIATGKPLFGLDYMEEGAAIAMLIHAPAFGMQLKSFDAAEAKGMPGIKEVFTINTSLEKPSWADVNAFNELIVVVGDSTWQVMQAKKAVKAEWERVSAAESSAAHLEQFASVFEGKGEVARQDGDPDVAFANADTVIERTYFGSFLAHNTLEPMNFFADVKADSARLIGPIQTPEALRGSAAAMLNIPEDKIHVDMTRMGGGFGRRLYGNFGLEAAAISQKIGAPVKLIYTREDDMTQGTYRPSYTLKYKAALDVDKNLTAFEVQGSGIPSSPVFANRYPAGTLANYRAENFGIDTNISTGAWRAPRSNFTAGAEQSFIDEVAEAAGKDPIDFRLELFDNAIANPVGERNDYDAERYAGVLKLVREKSNWGAEIDGVYRGVSAYYCHNSYVAQVIDLVMDDRGNPVVKKVWCAVDCGIVINKEGALNQIEGGIVDGLGHAMYSQLTFKDGMPEQQNFDRYRLIRNNEAPLEIEVFFAENQIAPTGLGEPGLPPVAGALASALYKATSKRYYRQPYMILEQETQILG